MATAPLSHPQPLEKSIPASGAATAQSISSNRFVSLDAFRGFTIAGMIFVIMVAGYRNLPQVFPAFGSAPVSTWKHASEDFDSAEWPHWHGENQYFRAKVTNIRPGNKYDVELNERTGPGSFANVAVRHSKPLQTGEEVIAVFAKGEGQPRFQGVGNGCTFTDLIAPFFVFIVGVTLPLSRGRRASGWWLHVTRRALLLIVAGVLYISLALKGLSWWWGILQTIGVAYFLGALFLEIPARLRWCALALLVLAHATLSWFLPWWTHLPATMSHGFFTIAHTAGDKLAPLNVHTTPWGSIGYAIITIVGTFIGEAIASRMPQLIVRQCLSVGTACALLGYGIHRLLIPMNKDNVSISYALFTAGIAALFFLLFFWIIDMKGWSRWAVPLNVFGCNALLAYFLQPLVRVFFVQLGLYSWFTGHSGWIGMAWGLAWTFILWLVCLWCNRRNLYWKF